MFLLLLLFFSTVEARVKPYRTTVITPNEIQSEYDFIIVGGGSSGTLLASRLSETPCWKILLIEAGEDEAFLSDVPLISILLRNTQFNWKFRNQPQESACLAYKDNRCNAPAGKVLGGSGTLGDMVYTRGHRKDYDLWASMGNPGWSFDEVLPYFLKTEKMKIPEYQNSSFHNTKGLLSVDRPAHKTKLADAFLEAGKELNYDVIDQNAGNNVGFSGLQVNLVKGMKCSGNRAFLSKASKRRNLDVLIIAQVTKIIIDPETQQAKGVEFIKNKRDYRVMAKKEIILTAGVFNSPKLLMLSGIGPENHLKELGIPLIKNLPVGRTMRDHYGFLGTMFKMNSSQGITLEKLANINTIIRFFRGDGYLTMTNSDGIAFLRTKYAVDERPDVCLIFFPGAIPQLEAVFRVLGIREDYIIDYFNNLPRDKRIWSFFAFLLKPNSTGSYRLRSKNPFDDPLIQTNYFRDEMDVKVLIEGIKTGIKLSKTKAFAKFGSSIIDRKIPGCECGYTFGTDEYWECVVRQLTLNAHHQLSTCQMGPANDENAVVDNELKVHGIKGLRVADVSVVPVHITAPTNAAAYMIAEKAADMIKKDWVNATAVVYAK